MEETYYLSYLCCLYFVIGPWHLKLGHWWSFLLWIPGLTFVKRVIGSFFVGTPLCQFIGQLNGAWIQSWGNSMLMCKWGVRRVPGQIGMVVTSEPKSKPL